MTKTNKLYLQTLRSLRGTPAYKPMLILLRELRRERQFRKHIEALRVDQSKRLLIAASSLDKLLYDSKRNK